MTIWNILWLFGIAVWYSLWSFVIFFPQFGMFGPRKIWQPCCSEDSAFVNLNFVNKRQTVGRKVHGQVFEALFYIHVRFNSSQILFLGMKMYLLKQ
jgi:hypothetical protein